MRHAEIIDRLAESFGSQAKLAERLDVDDTQVSKWKVRGIPARYWGPLVKAARGRMALKLDDIALHSPLRVPAKPSRAA